MTVGENIKRVRKNKRLTQKNLGDLCGIDEANIRKYENGRQIPKFATLGRIATALGVPMNELIDKKTNDTPIPDEFTFLMIKEKVKYHLYGYTSDEEKQIFEKIDSHIKKIYEIEDKDERIAYTGQALTVTLHDISDHILSGCTVAEFLDCLDLMGYYFSFKYNIRGDIMRLIKHLYGNQALHMGYISNPTNPSDQPEPPQE